LAASSFYVKALGMPQDNNAMANVIPAYMQLKDHTQMLGYCKKYHKAYLANFQLRYGFRIQVIAEAGLREGNVKISGPHQ
jgi:hypothetical protein